MLTRAKIARLESVLARKRDQHPELARPLTSAALKAVLRREGVLVKALPHPRDAELLAIEGRWAIIVDERRPHRERFIAAAHEAAHLWLHVDPGEPTTFDSSPAWYDEVREAEADYFAEMLVRGPVTSPSSARRGRQNKRVTDPDQLALDAPEVAREVPIVAVGDRIGARQPPIVAERAAIVPSPAADARAYERRVARAGAKKMTPRIVADRRTPDDERIEWGNGTRPTRYVEPDGHRWTIYNARIAIVDGRAKLDLVRDFMDRSATHRIFVDSAGQRRVYRFVPRELRAYKVKHLERQLREAKPWRSASAEDPRAPILAERLTRPSAAGGP